MSSGGSNDLGEQWVQAAWHRKRGEDGAFAIAHAIACQSTVQTTAMLRYEAALARLAGSQDAVAAGLHAIAAQIGALAQAQAERNDP